jgi:peptidoglycan/LPS O-acetylase OafA/YrhL
MRWYVLFPFVLVLFYRTKIGFALAMLAAIVLNRDAGVYDFGFLPTFMLGIVAARLTRTASKWHAVWPFAAIVAFALATNEQLHSLAIDHTSLYWAFGFFAAVLSVTTNPWLRRAFSWRPLVATGIASYSIYLVHMPFLDALAWCGVPAALAAVASIGIGFAFWYAIERPLCSNVARAAMDRALVRLYRVLTFKPSGEVTPSLTRAADSPAVRS